MLGKDKKQNDNFLVHRYFEDIGYMGYARKYVTENLLPDQGYDFYGIDARDGKVAELVKNAICSYMEENYPNVYSRVEEGNIKMPWIRMFETDVKIKTKNN